MIIFPIDRTAAALRRQHQQQPAFFSSEELLVNPATVSASNCANVVTLPVASPPNPPGKSCCGVHITQTVSIRWFIVMIAFVGICCSVVGTILGALKASGREHLTVSLLMIGVGIVLITVSGIAWRLTATDSPSC